MGIKDSEPSVRVERAKSVSDNLGSGLGNREREDEPFNRQWNLMKIREICFCIYGSFYMQTNMFSLGGKEEIV